MRLFSTKDIDGSQFRTWVGLTFGFATMLAFPSLMQRKLPSRSDLVPVQGRVVSTEEKRPFTDDLPIIYTDVKTDGNDMLLRYHDEYPRYSECKRYLMTYRGNLEALVRKSDMGKAFANIWGLRAGDLVVPFQSRLDHNKAQQENDHWWAIAWYGPFSLFFLGGVCLVYKNWQAKRKVPKTKQPRT